MVLSKSSTSSNRIYYGCATRLASGEVHGWWAESLTRGTVTTWRGESSRLVVSPGQRLFMPYHSSEPAQNEHRSCERSRRV
jgi:hypothetical protein